MWRITSIIIILEFFRIWEIIVQKCYAKENSALSYKLFYIYLQNNTKIYINYIIMFKLLKRYFKMQ